MTENITTPYSDKCQILGDLWLRYRSEPEFEDFLEYNDLGLPIAYAVANGIVKSTEMAEKFVDESFDLLLASLKVEDTGWDNLDELLSMANLS
jgi:hypothetical protein